VRLDLQANGPLHREYFIAAKRQGRETERVPIKVVAGQTRISNIVQFVSAPDTIDLMARCGPGRSAVLLAHKSMNWPDVEMDAQARPGRQINPIDLGTVLVPHGWLLLEGGQDALVTAAALSHSEILPNARLRAWFEDGRATEVAMPLNIGSAVKRELRLPLVPKSERDVLRISLMDGDRTIWTKEIPTMVVVRRPDLPSFGAVETKLRYEAPIPVTDPKTGALTQLNYDEAWSASINDVVVYLPNGSRYVFWRGASYAPFWAGRYNVGVSYQFAEDVSRPTRHPDGTVDFPEPLNDKELRFGRVRILESTASRVHVQWTYQISDLHYNTWGDHAIEDYYFYPDSFGTRVITIVSRPESKFQVTEFIVFTPQDAFPLEVLPAHVADVLFLDGGKQSMEFPRPPPIENPGKQELLYRIFDNKNDSTSAIYFTPRDTTPPTAFAPLYAASPVYDDDQQLVTPAHWSTHWPLARGRWTAWAGLNVFPNRYFDTVHAGPAHNSFLAFDVDPPASLFVSELPTLDADGQSRTMKVQRWAALIARTDASDESLRQWGRSFSEPPSIEARGARLDFPAYSIERRAVRLIVESASIEIKVKPGRGLVNPVFELGNAPRELELVDIDGKRVKQSDYAWDGATLWINCALSQEEAKIRLQFRGSNPRATPSRVKD